MAPEYVLFKKWRRSQVFMYPRKSKSIDKLTQKVLPPSHLNNPNIPSCFGNLLTSRYVLTATTCFMDMKKISKTNKNFLKSGIENFIFVQVTYSMDHLFIKFQNANFFKISKSLLWDNLNEFRTTPNLFSIFFKFFSTNVVARGVQSFCILEGATDPLIEQ